MTRCSVRAETVEQVQFVEVNRGAGPLAHANRDGGLITVDRDDVDFPLFGSTETDVAEMMDSGVCGSRRSGL